jgi:hypothetical protein
LKFASTISMQVWQAVAVMYLLGAAGCVQKKESPEPSPNCIARAAANLSNVMSFCYNNPCRPWFLLVPQYVARKAFFLEWLNNKRPKGTPKPSFVAPTCSPYVFTAPNRAGTALNDTALLLLRLVAALHCI